MEDVQSFVKMYKDKSVIVRQCLSYIQFSLSSKFILTQIC